MFDNLRPHRLVQHVAEVDCGELFTQGLRGVIIDLDNTLTAWRSLQVTPEVKTWLSCLQSAGLQACLVSNALSVGRVRPVAEVLRVPWVTRAAKPLPRGFLRGMEMMGTTPDTTAVVGDQLFTDILGGNRLGLFTILVEPLFSEEAWTTSLIQRPLERLVGRLPKEQVMRLAAEFAATRR